MKTYELLRSRLDADLRRRQMLTFLWSREGAAHFLYTLFRSRGFASRNVLHWVREFVEVSCLTFLGDLSLGALSSSMVLLQLTLASIQEAISVSYRAAMLNRPGFQPLYGRVAAYFSLLFGYSLFMALAYRQFGFHPIIFLIIGLRAVQNAASFWIFFKTAAPLFRQRVYVNPWVMLQIAGISSLAMILFLQASLKTAVVAIVIIGAIARISEQLYIFHQVKRKLTRSPPQPLTDAEESGETRDDIFRISLILSKYVTPIGLIALAQGHPLVTVTAALMVSGLLGRVIDRFFNAFAVDTFLALKSEHWKLVQHLSYYGLRYASAFILGAALLLSRFGAGMGLAWFGCIWVVAVSVNRMFISATSSIGLDSEIRKIVLTGRLALVAAIFYKFPGLTRTNSFFLVSAGVETLLAVGILISFKKEIPFQLEHRHARAELGRGGPHAYGPAHFWTTLEVFEKILAGDKKSAAFMRVTLNRSFRSPEKMAKFLAKFRGTLGPNFLCIAEDSHTLLAWVVLADGPVRAHAEKAVLSLVPSLIREIRWLAADQLTQAWAQSYSASPSRTSEISPLDRASFLSLLQVQLLERLPRTEARWWICDSYGMWRTVGATAEPARQRAYTRQSIRALHSPFLRMNRFQTDPELGEKFVVLRPFGQTIAIMGGPDLDSSHREVYDAIQEYCLKRKFSGLDRKNPKFSPAMFVTVSELARKILEPLGWKVSVRPLDKSQDSVDWLITTPDGKGGTIALYTAPCREEDTRKLAA
jgi:hypothetical protein